MNFVYIIEVLKFGNCSRCFELFEIRLLGFFYGLSYSLFRMERTLPNYNQICFSLHISSHLPYPILYTQGQHFYPETFTLYIQFLTTRAKHSK